ncbi:MAG: ribonuclease J [Erysipelotrichaceae bacterium]|nr:ribonuclease J [Erysipelotrichaceae bacterium]
MENKQPNSSNKPKKYYKKKKPTNNKPVNEPNNEVVTDVSSEPKKVVKYKPRKELGRKPVVKEQNVKVYSLGGLGVVGMNMYVVEVDDEIIVIDAGVLFADDDVHGVNYIIPDFTHLVENESRIAGLFITHGHEDHIGGLPFLLQKVKIPTIYAAGIAVPLIQNKLAEFPDIEYNLKEFTSDDVIEYKNTSVSFFRTNHSIPDSYGMAIKTKYGYVVNSGDFKFDFSPLGHMSDFHKMTRLGEEGVVCLLSESTNANIDEFSSSERKIAETLDSLFHQIEGRIIVATFASNVYRVQQIIASSIECGRKVIVFGHSMEKTIEAAIKLNYIEAPKGWILRARELKKIETEHVTILCTGSQGEPLAALSRIAAGTHKQIKLLPDDTIIYSSKPIPGNEQFINRNINKLVHAGAHVIKNNPLTDTHTTGHASQNELRMMLSFMKPKYFVPVHGEYFMLRKHVKIALGLGLKKENCFVLAPGDVLNINNNGATVIKDAVKASDVYLDGSLSDVDSNVLKERRKMADEGLVSATFFINKKKEIINKPIVTLNGFSTPDKADELILMLSNKCVEIYNNLNKDNSNISFSALERQIANQMYQFIYNKMDRKPLIVVSIKKIR